MSWTDDYLKAFANTVSASSEAGWFPFNWYRLVPFVADLDFARWQKIVETAKQKGVAAEELAKTFHGPLAPRFEVHYLMYECKVAGVAQTSEGKSVIEFLNAICKERCVDDIYGLAAAKIHTPEEIKKILAATPWQNTKPANARIVGNVIMAGIHLAYAYFSDYFYAQCFELSGPYPLPDGSSLIIRSFKNFHPLELWPEGPFPKFQTLEIFTIYDHAEIVIDQWSHIQSKHNLAQSLKKAAVLLDGRLINFDQVPVLVEEMAGCAGLIQNRWKKFDFERTKKLMMNLRWYQFKSAMQTLNLPWQPTADMRKRIKNSQLLPDITPQFQTAALAKKWWSDFVDPRLNNLPDIYIRPWEKNL